ncbi:MAG: hypothetical protein HY314_07300 [Acidobacteria bacterium]|nr:hypothetical protein [Acidobacteriota bacterium]
MESNQGIYQEIRYQGIIEELRRFSTLKALYESETYRVSWQALFWLLGVPEPFILEGVQPRVQDFVRVVQWNIEKGRNFVGLVEAFSAHPVLRYADLIFLNEVDNGMARSGNLHVARELGAHLRMHAAFAPAHLELTKGLGDDLDAPGENETALQGNALLSRYRLDQLRIIELPSYFEPFEFEEKRLGRRIALVAEVSINQKKLAAVCTHLEIRTTPRGRARQMAVQQAQAVRSSPGTQVGLDRRALGEGADGESDERFQIRHRQHQPAGRQGVELSRTEDFRSRSHCR